MARRDCDDRVITHLQRAVESARCDADDRERLLVEFELLADDGGVSVKSVLPQLVTEHNNRRSAGAIVFSSNGASQSRVQSQTGEVVCLRLPGRR